MRSRIAALLLAGALAVPPTARADNAMGYQLLSAEDAAALTPGGGSLGMKVSRAQVIHDADLNFDLLRVDSVANGSPAAQAGLKPGDQLIAVDGKVFPSVAAFAAYVGSVAPGRQVMMDYLPANGGPQQAQRVAVTVGEKGRAVPANDTSASGGLSTGSKVAIGVGAAALFGCYRLGCFSHGTARPQ